MSENLLFPFPRPLKRQYSVTCTSEGVHARNLALNIPFGVTDLSVWVSNLCSTSVSILLGTIKYYVDTIRNLTIYCTLRNHKEAIVIPQGILSVTVHTKTPLHLKTAEEEVHVSVHEWGLSKSRPQSLLVPRCKYCDLLCRPLCVHKPGVGSPEAPGAAFFRRSRSPTQGPFNQGWSDDVTRIY